MDIDKIVIKDDQFRDPYPSFNPRVDNGFGMVKGYITEDAYFEKDKVYVTFQLKYTPGDILNIKGVMKNLYIKRFKGFGTTRKGGFKFEVGRTDGYPVSQVEVDGMKVGTWVQACGYFKDCNSCN